MQKKLCMLLLLSAWFVVQNAYAQKPKNLTPEQEKQWQDGVATNHMILMRQNPPTTPTPKETISVEKTKNQEVQIKHNASDAEKELTVRKLRQKYDAGTLPPATGAVAIMEAQGVSTLAEVKLDKLSDTQKAQLFETEPTLQEEWKKYEPKLSQMDKASQEQLRKQLWEKYQNKELRIK